jgi:hypothetical protein
LYAKTSGSSTPGPQGEPGIQGETGTAGAAGTNGTNGTQGIQGAIGTTGTNGTNGAKGDVGAKGEAGVAGTQGIQGAIGTTGTNGTNGAKGDVGEKGEAGVAGTQGIQGATGPSGADGSTGIPTGGTEGQLLKIVGGIPTWVDPAVIGQTFYEDSDNDGYGDINSTIFNFVAPNGYVSDNTDCNDTDAAINPATVWFIGVDTDGDTFFASTTSLTQCESPGIGYVITEPATLDCDDSLATGSSINPDAIEDLANGIDDDCDGQVDEATVGELREGGIVFWVDPADNRHGKVCALDDPPTTVGPTPGLDWTAATTFFNNYTNLDTGTGVYSNWYLPSRDELQLMYVNLQRFGCSTNTTVGGVDASLCPTRKGNFSYFYWSSTEYDNDDPWEVDNDFAWYQHFGNGDQSTKPKDISDHVRAVRAF